MDVSRGGVLLSVNLAAQALPTPHDTGRTGIGKHPVSWRGRSVHGVSRLARLKLV